MYKNRGAHNDNSTTVVGYGSYTLIALEILDENLDLDNIQSFLFLQIMRQP